MPIQYRENIRAWRQTIPRGFELRGWDHASALGEFPFYAAYGDFMSHHAMRADMILLSAQIKYGGIVVGTDMRPNRCEGMFDLMIAGRSFVVRDIAGCYYNGMSFAGAAFDARFCQIFEIMSKYPSLFNGTQVPAVTGPLRWTSILGHMDHELEIVPDRVAWTRSYWERQTTRPDAWVDPGFAASHHVERTG